METASLIAFFSIIRLPMQSMRKKLSWQPFPVALFNFELVLIRQILVLGPRSFFFEANSEISSSICVPFLRSPLLHCHISFENALRWLITYIIIINQSNCINMFTIWLSELWQFQVKNDFMLPNCIQLNSILVNTWHNNRTRNAILVKFAEKKKYYSTWIACILSVTLHKLTPICDNCY